MKPPGISAACVHAASDNRRSPGTRKLVRFDYVDGERTPHRNADIERDCPRLRWGCGI
jgi:hypothetical protein